MAQDPVTGVSDAISGISKTVTTLLSIVSKAMDFIPNYDQRKRKQFYEYKIAYENEKNKIPEHRDDNLVDVYRNRLLNFVEIFKDDLYRTEK